MLVGLDVYRPAAIEQLDQLAQKIDVPCYTDRTSKKAEEIALAAKEDAERRGFNVLIVDTAGRLQIDEELMEELVRVKKAVKPHEILLVVDALTGQDAVNAAQGFDEKLGIDGIIMTKMDGDSRGGAALSAKKVTGKPVKFMGMGEKFDALEPFHPERMASRILGMGDMLTLIEKAQETFDEEKAAKLEKKLRKNEFTLEDYLEQMGQITQMGGIAKMLDMIPGVNKNKVSDKTYVDNLIEGGLIVTHCPSLKAQAAWFTVNPVSQNIETKDSEATEPQNKELTTEEKRSARQSRLDRLKSKDAGQPKQPEGYTKPSPRLVSRPNQNGTMTPRELTPQEVEALLNDGHTKEWIETEASENDINAALTCLGF